MSQSSIEEPDNFHDEGAGPDAEEEAGIVVAEEVDKDQDDEEEDGEI